MTLLTLPAGSAEPHRAKALVFEDPRSLALLARVAEVAPTSSICSRSSGCAAKLLQPLLTGGSLAHVLALDYGLKLVPSLEPKHIASGLFVLDKWLAMGERGAESIDPDVSTRLAAAVAALVESVRALVTADVVRGAGHEPRTEAPLLRARAQAASTSGARVVIPLGSADSSFARRSARSSRSARARSRP